MIYFSRAFLTALICFYTLGAFAEGPIITQTKLPGKFKFGEIERGSSYHKVGIRTGDTLKLIDGKIAGEETRLDDVIAVFKSGGVLVIERKGHRKVLKVKPGSE
jgi:hypothetical protein